MTLSARGVTWWSWAAKIGIVLGGVCWVAVLLWGARDGEMVALKLGSVEEGKAPAAVVGHNTVVLVVMNTGTNDWTAPAHLEINETWSTLMPPLKKGATHRIRLADFTAEDDGRRFDFGTHRIRRLSVWVPGYGIANYVPW